MESHTSRFQDLTRREFSATLAAAAALAFSGVPASAASAEETFAAIFARLSNGTAPATGSMTFDIADYAENGLMVSYTIKVDSPMTQKDHVQAIHILSSANVKPIVTVFRLTPAAGKAEVAGRIRLSKTQKVVAVAELTGGRAIVREKAVSVAVGSCG